LRSEPLARFGRKCVLPVDGDLEAPPFEIVCDPMEVALAHMERLRKADLVEFERG
jgi:hypothetical protein